MAEPESKKPTLVSDGRRMRSVWFPGDGNGNSAHYLIKRNMNTLKGHPTWKIYVDEIDLPIARGSPNEPPRYVYLDDKACYTIWCTGAYTKAELAEFWPFDFNSGGNVKSGRKNRGRPAWSDETETQYAKAPLRGKGNEFEFCGELDVTEYAPVRPKLKTKMEEVVAQEIAEEKQAKEGGLPIEGNQAATTQLIEANNEVSPSPTTSKTPDRSVYPSQTKWSPSMTFQTPKRPLPTTSLQLGLKPMPLTPRPFEGPSNSEGPNSWKHKRGYFQISGGSQKVPKHETTPPPAKRVNRGAGL